MRHATNWACLLAVVGTAAITFIVRQGTLAGIRAENDHLRRQREEQPVMAEPAVVQSAPVTNVVSELTPEDQRELLRLRGQIQPLRRELVELSNQVARAEQRRSAYATALSNAPVMTPEAKARFQAMQAETAVFMQTDRARNAQRLAQALSKYLKANGGNMPASLAELEGQAQSTLPAGISQQFEVVASGQVPERRRQMIVACEREASTNGTGGFKTQIFICADGAIKFGLEQAPNPAWQRLGAAAAESLGLRTSQTQH